MCLFSTSMNHFFKGGDGYKVLFGADKHDFSTDVGL